MAVGPRTRLRSQCSERIPGALGCSRECFAVSLLRVDTIQIDQTLLDHATFPPTLHLELDAAPKLAIGVGVRSSATGAAVFEAPSLFSGCACI